MKKTPYVLDFSQEDKPIAFKELIGKYLKYWPWFVLSCALFLTLGYFYEKYAPRTYTSETKIKILDSDLETKVLQKEVVSNSQNLKLNLENHIEVLKSNQLLDKVVRDLNLDIEYFLYKDFSFRQIESAPFEILKNVFEDELDNPLEYEMKIQVDGYHITDKNGKKYVVPYDVSVETLKEILPFGITLREDLNIDRFGDNTYKVVLKSNRYAVMELSEKLAINTSEKESDVLSLSLKGQSKNLSESILNAIVRNFELDEVEDKQLVNKRTLEIIDERFNDLSRELDSIEAKKMRFKVSQNLSYIETDASVNLQRKSGADAEILKLETQISLLRLLKKNVTNKGDYNLLPADIGLANNALNNLVDKYNGMARERQKLELSVSPNHPRLRNLSELLDYARDNIAKTVKVYESQLAISRAQLNKQSNEVDNSYAELPEQERVLRAIERQQSIKENLYLLLLEKREEAAIEYAATSSSVKVIDYAFTGVKPMWPKKTLIYPLSLILGLIAPFMFIVLRSSFDTKVSALSDIEKLNPEIPTIIEIPMFKGQKNFSNVTEGSAFAEAFRILSTNTDHLIGKGKHGSGKVIFVTSAIKEEGKTFLAMNLSLAYASLGKRVLLVGSDLRNPQLHRHTKLDKNALGLSNFLKDQWFSFYDGVQEGFENNPFHKIYLSGKIPKSAPAILSGNRYAEFIEMAKKEFDYIIVDTAPTMLVTDTLLISKYADATLFVVRSELTDKKLLQFSKELNNNHKLNNMAYVLNGVGKIKDGKYNYGYAYGYENHI